MYLTYRGTRQPRQPVSLVGSEVNPRISVPSAATAIADHCPAQSPAGRSKPAALFHSLLARRRSEGWLTGFAPPLIDDPGSDRRQHYCVRAGLCGGCETMVVSGCIPAVNATTRSISCNSHYPPAPHSRTA